MNAIAPITVRPIVRPQYMNAPVTLETFERWFICNHSALTRFWAQLEQLGTRADFVRWAHCQYDIAKLDSPTSAATADKSSSHGQKDVPTADPGTAGVGILYPVTCRARYYDAASRILEDELHLFTHANADELGLVIEQWIEKKRENWEPRS